MAYILRNFFFGKVHLKSDGGSTLKGVITLRSSIFNGALSSLFKKLVKVKQLHRTIHLHQVFDKMR